MAEDTIWISAVLRFAQRLRVGPSETVKTLMFSRTKQLCFIYHNSRQFLSSFTSNLQNTQANTTVFPWKKIAILLLPFEPICLRVVSNFSSKGSKDQAYQAFCDCATDLAKIGYFPQALDIATFADYLIGLITPSSLNIGQISSPKEKRLDLRAQIHSIQALCLTEMGISSGDPLLWEEASKILNESIMARNVVPRYTIFFKNYIFLPSPESIQIAFL